MLPEEPASVLKTTLPADEIGKQQSFVRLLFQQIVVAAVERLKILFANVKVLYFANFTLFNRRVRLHSLIELLMMTSHFVLSLISESKY